MQIEAYDDWNVRSAAHTVEQRLPPDARRVLQNVRVWTDARCPNAADAGDLDIRVRPGLRGSQAALIGILAHELGHVAGSHYKRCAAGVLSAEAAEIEADRYCRAWGFGPELEHRRMFYGR